MAKKKNFRSADSLKGVKVVISEADAALTDKTRTISSSKIPDVLAGALGAGVGGTISFAALYCGGAVAGLSAAGITSGLAAAGGVVGGVLAAGAVVLAAPVIVLGGAAYSGVAIYKKKLNEEKESLYNLALQKHQAIINELKNRLAFSTERIQYLESINILLQKAIHDLKEDLDNARSKQV